MARPTVKEVMGLKVMIEAQRAEISMLIQVTRNKVKSLQKRETEVMDALQGLCDWVAKEYSEPCEDINRLKTIIQQRNVDDCAHRVTLTRILFGYGHEQTPKEMCELVTASNELQQRVSILTEELTTGDKRLAAVIREVVRLDSNGSPC